MKKFEVSIEGTTELLMHKFNGLDEEARMRQLPIEEQARKHAHLTSDGTLYIPSDWIHFAIRDAFVRRVKRNQKDEERQRVSPSIKILPPQISLNTKKYDIDIRSAPAKGRARDFCVRPKLSKWKAEFTILSGLPESGDDIRRILEQIGSLYGIGSNRVNGYGRFKVTSFTEVANENRGDKTRIE